jgi:plasmid stability protein
MASITIRGLDDALKQKLRMRAAEHGRSMEAEAREILRGGLTGRRRRTLVEKIRDRFGPLGGVDIPEFPDQPMSDPHIFE